MYNCSNWVRENKTKHSSIDQFADRIKKTNNEGHYLLAGHHNDFFDLVLDYKNKFTPDKKVFTTEYICDEFIHLPLDKQKNTGFITDLVFIYCNYDDYSNNVEVLQNNHHKLCKHGLYWNELFNKEPARAILDFRRWNYIRHAMHVVPPEGIFWQKMKN